MTFSQQLRIAMGPPHSAVSNIVLAVSSVIEVALVFYNDSVSVQTSRGSCRTSPVGITTQHRAGVTDLLIPLRIPVESLLILLPPSVDTGGRGAVSCDVSNCSAI